MFQYILKRVVTAVVVVGSAIAIIWYWNLPDESKAAMWDTASGTMTWIGIALSLPWATFFIPARVVRVESNSASAVMLAGYFLADAGAAFWMAGGTPDAAWKLGVMIVGLLAVAAYNMFACNFIAERCGD